MSDSIQDTNDVYVEETVDALVEEIVDAQVEENVDTPVEETVDALVEEIVDTPVEETVDTPVEETVDTPVEETVDAPAEETVDTPVEETVDALAEETVIVVVEETVDAPVDTPVEETLIVVVEETVDAPVEETVDIIPEETPSDNITFTVDTNNQSSSIPDIIFIIPYRDREKQYEFFSKHMKTVLEDFSPDSFKIFYIHQNDSRSFNRGAVKNIGFLTVKNMYPNDYQNMTLVFNDIDIMPYTKNFFNYHTSPGTVKHFYGFTFTLGGIVSINAKDFERINGFPNFWSWGYEDNMLQNRILQNGIVIDRSVFYPILDKNVLHFSEGITRNVNRTEYDIYEKNTKEGVDSISDLQYNYNADTGFIDVTNFSTSREEDTKTTQEYDLRKGNVPFPSNKQPQRRRPRMGMIM